MSQTHFVSRWSITDITIYDDIADAIRAKTGQRGVLTPFEMADAIRDGIKQSPIALAALGAESNHDIRTVDVGEADWVRPESGTWWIRSYAFYNTNDTYPGDTKRLRSVTIPSWIAGIGRYAFQYSGLQAVELPGGSGSQLYMHEYAFANTDIRQFITERVVYRYGSASSLFKYCTSLATVEMGVSDAVATSCFEGCTALASVTLNGNFYSISSRAFYGCTSLASITITCTARVVTIYADALTSVPADCNIYVPSDLVENYKTASNWSTRASYIQAIPSSGE